MSQISQMLDVEHPGIFAAYAPVRKTNTILRTPLGGTRDHLQYVLEWRANVCRGALVEAASDSHAWGHCGQNDAGGENLDQNVRISRRVISNRALFKHVRAMFGQWNSKLVVIIILTAAICGILVFLAFDLPTLFVPRDE
jgi:hypothetical protein